jgi:hypothetical protein
MNKRRKRHKKTTKRFPNHTATIELVVDRIGGKGDGYPIIHLPIKTITERKSVLFYSRHSTRGTHNHPPYFQNSRRYIWTTFGNHKNLY